MVLLPSDFLLGHNQSTYTMQSKLVLLPSDFLLGHNPVNVETPVTAVLLTPSDFART